MKLTLLQRPGRVGIPDFETALQNQLSSVGRGLSARAGIIGYSKGGWAQVDVTGQDHEILEELISREFDLATTNLSRVELFGNYLGLADAGHRDYLEVDIGVELPRFVRVQIGLDTLRSQLCDGRQRTAEEIIDTYCLYPGSRVAVRISRLQQVSESIDGWLADSEIGAIRESVSAGLQCVKLFHCTRSQVENAVRKVNLERDIVSIDSPTLTTHSIVCKLGTDAVGLIPKLGPIVRKSELKPFIPSRIISRCREW